MTEADVLIIGSGQAGAPLSWRLAGAGNEVVLAERGELGGTCVNTGCTPTKTFIAAAEAAHRARVAERLGVDVDGVHVDMARVVARTRDVVRTWRAGVERKVEEAGDGLRLVRGHARFVGPRTVEVGGQHFTAPVVIVNTGCRPRVPALRGLSDVPFLTNRNALQLQQLPEHLVVLGGGYVGCELGQAFRRLGSQVTVVQSSPHVLAREDPDVSEALEGALREEGMTLRLGARAVSVHRPGGGGVSVALDDGTQVSGSHLLVAAGRVPNTDDLGCREAGVTLDERGYVVVDDHYATSAEGVYAVGDCTGGPQFTHASWDDHRILFQLLRGNTRRTRADRLVPHATFTDPQVARVGLSEGEARRNGVAYDVGTVPFSGVSRAYETDRTAGRIKVLVGRDDGRILGACVVGAEAAELVTVFQMLMMAEAPAQVLVDAEMIHPAFVEGVQSALMSIPRYALS